MLKEVTYQLSGSTGFSKLDALCEYWCVVLSEESSRATTFNILFGWYHFLSILEQLTAGAIYEKVREELVPFADVFQEKMDKIANGLSGVISVKDDV